MSSADAGENLDADLDSGPRVRGLGSLVLYSARVEACAAFYRALGLPLEPERHGDGPLHFAASVGGAHVAVFEATVDRPACPAAPKGADTCSFAGFTVSSVEACVAAARALGAPVLEEPVRRSWGVRAILEDPDGRPVEVFARPVADG